MAGRVRQDWCGICSHYGIETPAVSSLGTWHCADYGTACCGTDGGRWGLCEQCAAELAAGQPERPALAELDMVPS